MASKKHYYAIKSGRDPSTDERIRDMILSSWAEAYPLVHGAPGAVYAGFASKGEAEAWLMEKKTDMSGDMDVPDISKTAADLQETAIGAGAAAKAVRESARITRRKNQGVLSEKKAESSRSKSKRIRDVFVCPPDTLCCYVDGSFNDRIPNYSFGIVCVLNDEIIHSAGGTGKNAEAISMRQIAGELLGAMQALVYARRKGYARVIILHDYKGVSMHADGTWKRTNPFSGTYHDWMQAFFRDNPGISVKFLKVDAHAGNRFNELADVLAKTAVGMAPDPEYLKLAQSLGLMAGTGATASLDYGH